MIRSLLALAVTASLSTAALAELEPGETAPDFTVSGFQAGEPVDFTLSEALESGPVVLFFFPAAFTDGCEAQAASFAESIEDFHALGAQVIGVTAGNTERLADFSTQHCADAFPVFAIADDMMSEYEVRLMMRPGWTQRTTYVIGTDQTIVLEYTELNPYEHVDRSLEALRTLAGGQ
ncbi:peroxiredoxin [Hyphobacterium sp. HN65]|uniref:thioredoxin-dependent peroxiredoxin n=1 Tax=Hyphobacterium lacteum TaxID=3116575 RepID=A0ABU7LSK4_9PROT|nr:peroxiredoxin [Hyphobacterium sp. HN65]MEE2526873.1 peroxiredoxin [Hyphobacterium sp. HN65]